MAWVVCSECYSEFPLSHIEQYVQHKLTKCRALTATAPEEPGFQCGYCIERFNTSLALLLHISKHDVKVTVAQRHCRMANHARPLHNHDETSCECDSEMESESCCEFDNEETSACCNHTKPAEQRVKEHNADGAVANGGDSATLHAENAVRDVSGVTSSPCVIHKAVSGLQPVADLSSDPSAPAALDALPAAPGKAHSATHSTTTSHHHVKRHACAQTACTAFEQKSRCCCVDINGQVMRLVSLGIIKLPDCCEPPVRPHRHCVTHGEHHARGHPHAHPRDRSDSSTSGRRGNQEDATQTLSDIATDCVSEAAHSTDHQSPSSAVIKLERSSPCACTTGCCERCARRDRADGECQTEFEWVDLDVDFDVDALLDGGAPRAAQPSIADLQPAPAPPAPPVAPSSRGRARPDAKQFDLPTTLPDAGPQASLLTVAPFSNTTVAAYPRTFPSGETIFAGGASIESLSLATGHAELTRRAGRFSGPERTPQTSAHAQPMLMSRDAGLLFAQSSPLPDPDPAPSGARSAHTAPGSQPSQHGKVFQCEQCGREFKQAIHLRKHNWSLHSNDGKPYKCPLTSTGECSYASVEKTHLQAHIRTHTGEKPYKCKYCDYAGKQSSTLRSHMLHKHPQEMLSERQFAALSPKHY